MRSLFDLGPHIWQKKVLQVIMYSSLTCCKKLHNNTFRGTEIKYYYNAESKYRSLKK